MREKVINLFDELPVGIITFSASGEIDYVNNNFEKLGILYQLDHPSPLGINIFQTELFPEINISEELKELQNGFPFEREIKHIKTNDGGQITLIVKGSPIYEGDVIEGGLLLIEDIKILANTRDELKLRANYIETAVGKANDFLLVANSEGGIQFYAGTAIEKLKIKGKPITGSRVPDLFNASEKNSITKNFQKVVESKEPVKFHFGIDIENKHFDFECRIEPLISTRGIIRFVYLFFNDVTSQLQESKSLTQEISYLNYYRSVVSNMNFAVIGLNLYGNIIYMDDRAEDLLNLKTENGLNEFLGSFLKGLDREKFDQIRKQLNDSPTVNIKAGLISNEDEEKILNLNISLLDNTQNILLVLCSDVTGETKKNEGQKTINTTLKNIVDKTDELICKISKEGEILYANRALQNKTGYSAEDLRGINFYNLISAEDLPNLPLNSEHIAWTRPEKVKLRLLSSDGNQINTNAKIIPGTEIDDEQDFYYCYLTDISDSSGKDVNLQFYQSLFESSLDGIAVEFEGKIVIANDSFANIFGYDKGEDMRGRELLDLVSNDDVLKVAEYLRLQEKNKNAPDRFEFLAKKSDSSYFYTELSISTFESDNRTYVVMVARDVTERKRAQKVIRESEEKYRNLTENIDDFLYTFERSGNILRPLFYTSSVEKITGYSQADLLSDSRLILKIIHPDDFKSFKIKLAGVTKSSYQASSEMEFRIINKHGNIVWIRNKLSFIRDENGIIQKIYGLVSDITLKKRAEEELRRSAVNLKQINDTKDRFISIISHDLRTPFSSILGFTDLLANDEALSDEEKKQYINFIQESSKSMLSLVNSLLDWTRLQTGRIKFDPEKVGAKEIIEKSIGTVSGAAIRKGVEIEINADDEYSVFVDKNLIQQVFNNLLSNAIKFTSERDLVTVTVKPSSSIRFLEFAVKDTGSGIKKENIDKLFNIDTKFTSEGTAGEKGSGLGLSLVKEIIDKHGGMISVQSEYGKGSEFKFTLPVASASIMIVDSNTRDRILYSKIIKNITPEYSVDIASNGKEALEKLKTLPPALVITEHQMPELNGYEFVKKLIETGLISTLPVIVLSSNIERGTMLEYAGLGIEFVFRKPVNLRSFKDAVEKSLRKSVTGNNNSR